MNLSHPDSWDEYSNAVIDGVAAPSVYPAIVEAGIADAVLPASIENKWVKANIFWSTVAFVGALLIYFDSTVLGIIVIVASLWLYTRRTKPLGWRVGYIAALQQEIGMWGIQRGYLSLQYLHREQLRKWQPLNETMLDVARQDLESQPSQLDALIVFNGSILLPLAKIALGVALLLKAWHQPSVVNIFLGGSIAIFFLVQSLVRLPLLLKRR